MGTEGRDGGCRWSSWFRPGRLRGVRPYVRGGVQTHPAGGEVGRGEGGWSETGEEEWWVRECRKVERSPSLWEETPEGVGRGTGWTWGR